MFIQISFRLHWISKRLERERYVQEDFNTVIEEIVYFSYHFHRKNNFDNEDDYFEHEHQFLQMMMIVECYKQNIENIQYDNINQVIQ